MNHQSPTTHTSRRVFLATAASSALCGRVHQARAASPASIELTILDPAATGYGTFQSHNQKVAHNAHGIFATHIRTRNEPYTAQQWRLSHSADGGRTFRTLHEATHPTNPPAIEAAPDGTLYLARPDFVDGHAYLDRFLPSEGFARPHTTRIPGGSAGKYCLMHDPHRERLYYFAHNNTFHVILLDGTVASSTTLIASGPDAILQYPHLSLAEDGTLLAAWTTQKHGVYLYWDIHAMRSTDGGATWTTLAGRPLAPPVVADQHGPADRITLDDEFEAHTWLSSTLARGGQAHFVYLAQTTPPRQHHVHVELNTGRRLGDTQPELKGTRLAHRGLDGFFATRRLDPAAPIFFVGRDPHAPRLVCLVSRDQGRTWEDHAVSETVTNPYAVGGAREITPDGWIVGTFTDQIAPTTDPGGGSRVMSFRIRAGDPPTGR